MCNNVTTLMKIELFNDVPLSNNTSTTIHNHWTPKQEGFIILDLSYEHKIKE